MQVKSKLRSRKKNGFLFDYERIVHIYEQRRCHKLKQIEENVDKENS